MSKETNRSSEAAATATRPGRRAFLVSVSVMMGAAAAAFVALPALGFIFGPALGKQRRAWRGIGPADSFPIGETVPVSFEDANALPWDGVSGRTAAWLRRESADTFVAFAVNCTHLGCPVRWEPQANLFLCPCHGGVYQSSGAVAGGPPPRPLHRYHVRVRDGAVEIEAAPIPIAESRTERE